MIGLNWVNLVLIFVNMIMGAVNHNWSAMLGWFVAFTYVVVEIIKYYLNKIEEDIDTDTKQIL